MRFLRDDSGPWIAVVQSTPRGDVLAPHRGGGAWLPTVSVIHVHPWIQPFQNKLPFLQNKSCHARSPSQGVIPAQAGPQGAGETSCWGMRGLGAFSHPPARASSEWWPAIARLPQRRIKMLLISEKKSKTLCSGSVINHADSRVSNELMDGAFILFFAWPFCCYSLTTQRVF